MKDDTATLRRDWDKMDTLERIHAQKEGRLPPPFGGEEAEDPRIYNLIRGGSRKGYHRLRIVREDGSYFSVHHDDIHAIEGTADGSKLTLCIRGGLMVTLTGRNLERLADYLEECNVRKLYAYQPSRQRLAEPTTPVITLIVEETPNLQREACS